MLTQLRSLLFVAFVSVSCTNASASLQFTFDGANDEFSGSGGTFGGSVVVTIMQNGANTVDVSINGSSFSGPSGAFIEALYLNYDPSKDPTLLGDSFSGTDPNLLDVFYGTNAFKPDGDGDLDIRVDWENSNNSPGRFGPGESDMVTFTLNGLVEDDFNFVSVNGPVGKNGFGAVLRLQGLTTGSGSGWFGTTGEIDPGGNSDPMPEPTSVAVWSLLAMFAAGVTCRGQP